MNRNKISPARAVAIVGISAAAIECGKLALAALPNIEVVSLLVATFSYVFGPLGFLATVIFVSIEPMIYGFGSWVISYIVYWPILSLVFVILRRLRVKNRILITGTAVLMTFFFGILSSLIDVGLFSGFFENFLARFYIYYARGIIFYALQIACNATLFPLLFPVLTKKLEIIIKLH